MKVFNRVIYIAGSHSIKRMGQRAKCPRKICRYVVEKKAQNGTILLDAGNHRYIRNGDLYLPCILLEESNGIKYYKVKSVLNWYMVKNRLQNIVDNYSEYEEKATS